MSRFHVGKVLVGQIVGAHGVRGEVRVRSFTADPHSLGAYGPVEDESGQRRFTVAVLGQTRDGVRVRLSGIADRDAAETLRGLRLYVPRERLPPPTDADEFYLTDLIGLKAVTADGAPFGAVVAVHNFGAGDILEIRRDASASGGVGASSDGATVMLPFTRAAVPQVDLGDGRIVVDPPAGLLDGGADRTDEDVAGKDTDGDEMGNGDAGG